MASRTVKINPKPVASVRPIEPPPPTGLPVIRPGVYWPTSWEYSFIIQPIIWGVVPTSGAGTSWRGPISVSYTHLRAHETRHDLVCRLLLEKKKDNKGTKAEQFLKTENRTEKKKKKDTT